jgi:hypothetical protein
MVARSAHVNIKVGAGAGHKISSTSRRREPAAKIMAVRRYPTNPVLDPEFQQGLIMNWQMPIRVGEAHIKISPTGPALLKMITLSLARLRDPARGQWFCDSRLM